MLVAFASSLNATAIFPVHKSKALNKARCLALPSSFAVRTIAGMDQESLSLVKAVAAGRVRDDEQALRILVDGLGQLVSEITGGPIAPAPLRSESGDPQQPPSAQ